MARYSFKKNERLTGKKNISHLFLSGNFFRIKPFKVFWKIVDKDSVGSRSRLLISVPKKIQKTSVSRNLLKRRIRESYRTNKEQYLDFITKNNISIYWGVVYLSAEILSSQIIEEKMILTLQQLIKEIEIKDKIKEETN